ncbi:glutaredoxin family protein [Prescottella equi]|uniref:glutaredoxin family protein n=1 Tax=Rhodococcus hoagii TaxID=43767 RepID=UPI000D0F947F|nr:glutaredoxin family protein [Prescottella equi]AVP71298.1 NrdH-redoxin [Prescottella equi]
MLDIHPDAPRVTLVSAPGCGRCNVAARDMTKRGIPFDKVDGTVDTEWGDRAKALGYLGAPVTICGDMHWDGYRENRIDELEQALTNWTPDTPALTN